METKDSDAIIWNPEDLKDSIKKIQIPILHLHNWNLDFTFLSLKNLPSSNTQIK